MGIYNIHILMPPEIEAQYGIDPVRQAEAARQQLLINAHKNGEHPYGRMRRDCPLCQQDK